MTEFEWSDRVHAHTQLEVVDGWLVCVECRQLVVDDEAEQ